LNQRQILNWRMNFNSSFAATYHPWLQISRSDDSRDALIHLPPSAVAAGIIARQEMAFGVPHGPANALAAEVIDLDDRVAPARHDELHTQGVNVYLRERDGIRLTAARTLSRDPAFRQLSVRRLMTMISRALYQQMQWVVFEPNRTALRAELRLVLRGYLRRLFRLGAFRGATEEQAFFVRCDETNNPAFIADAGRLIAEIGVAPSEPLEFIVLRLAREGDGMLVLEEK
jgi:phage tail sheath protein FI